MTFHCSSSIPLGSRIMAVADIFTAITEDRPYRAGMPDHKAAGVLTSMVADNSICSYVVSMLMDNFEMINDIRKMAQQQSSAEYKGLMEPFDWSNSHQNSMHQTLRL